METRLDRTQFEGLSFEAADKAMQNTKHLSPAERLAIANLLIAAAYNFPINNPPKMDKTICVPRNLKNG
jgi:hypothetical protein